MTKTKRQEAIVRLIESAPIDTQEELRDRLLGQGIAVTQATISRDIRELGIHKVHDADGVYRYVSGFIPSAARDPASKFAIIFAESALSVASAQNIVVVKCRTGMANAACATFDAADMEGVLGTLSGDDTFIVITETTENAERICTHLRSLIGQES